MGMWRGMVDKVRSMFSVPAPIYRPIDIMIAEMLAATGRVSRSDALSVPAVLRGRNLLCGSVATMPLRQVDALNNTVPLSLLTQIDRDIANEITLAQTVEDLLFEGTSWWRITEFGYDGYPLYATHLDYNSVVIQPRREGSEAPLPGGPDPRGADIYVDGVKIEKPEQVLIRFDSPNPPLLVAGGRAIRRALLLDQTAQMYSGTPRPLDYFTAKDSAREPEDEQVQEFLGDWAGYRRRRATGYVPAWANYNTVDTPAPRELQLVELQNRAALDLANVMGLDPEDLGISTTSRTYQNATDRRQDRINDVLAPYVHAIAGRLSMGDVTRRGYKIVFDFNSYLRADPNTRIAYYEGMKRLGAMTPEEVRAEEGKPPLTAAQRRELAPAPAATDTPPVEEPVSQDNARPALRVVNFGTAPHTFVNLSVQNFKADAAARTVEGLALPYGKVGQNYSGRYRFAKGALTIPADLSRVKLLRDHNYTQLLGKLVHAQETDDGLFVRYHVARGAAGDEALSLAEDGALDGFSVGVDFDMAADTAPDPDNQGVLLVRRADWRETSLTGMPAFDDARVAKVAASKTSGGKMHTCGTCGAELTPGVAHTCATPAATVAETPEQFQARLTAHLAAGGQPGLFPMTPQPEPRAVINPVPRATLQVTDPQPYRFMHTSDSPFGTVVRGTHEWSTDVIAAINGDREANQRLAAFAAHVLRQEFVVTTDVDELNPTRQRPDMYVDQRSYEYPMWAAINKGTLSDITPFTFPKFSSAGTLVAAHVEGTEPSLGTFVTTSQTVTPAALSGKVKITRETIDQGGNPQVSALIWRQMLKAWYEALEARAALVLTANAASITDVTLTTGGGTTGQTAASETERAFTDLQFVRGGFSMDTMFTQIDYFRVLAAAKDTAGRPLYPRLGPMNANGQAQARFRALDVAGVVMWPAWALAASGSVAASSFLFDREVVHGWASAPQRIDIDKTEVANVYIGLFGYAATAISDFTGVREFVYDPV